MMNRNWGRVLSQSGGGGGGGGGGAEGFAKIASSFEKDLLK